MKTLSVTDGRSKLGHWLKRAIAGDDIGIVVDGVVVGLRPVGVISEDYALREYGLTQDEAIHKALEDFPDSPEVQTFVDFIRTSKRGITR